MTDAKPTSRFSLVACLCMAALVAFVVCTMCALTSCSKEGSAHSTDDLSSAARSATQNTSYSVEIPADAVDKVLEDAAAAAQSSSTTGMGNALAFSFDLSREGVVILRVETLSSDMDAAIDTATELAIDLADYVVVTDEDGNEVEPRTFMGALYDAYDLAIELFDHGNTFSLSGGKTVDQEEITWQ